MDRKKIILLVAALVIAALTAFMARSIFAGASAPKAAAKPVPKGPEVLVATRSLPVGTIITEGAFRYQPWPKELVENAYFAKVKDESPDMKDLLGTVVRHQITAGQPITKGSLVSPGDRGFLAAALGPGMRAVSVPINRRTTSGFIFPGDRVDLLLTQTVVDPALPGGGNVQVSETIMRNIRVLATDQRARTSIDKKGNTRVKRFRMITVEVTPAMAEKISVSLAMGTLSLSLRSIADNQAELEQALAKGDVKIPEGASAEEEEKILAKAKSRPIAGKGTYTTGGQVSQFRRSDVNVAPKSREGMARRAIQNAAYNGSVSRAAARANRGKVVRVSEGGSVREVELDRR